MSGHGKVYSKEEYDTKFSALETILESYHQYGLANDLHLDYKYDDKYEPILSLYIDDMWGKIDAYQGLFLRLSSFDKFLKSKDLSYKKSRLIQSMG